MSNQAKNWQEGYYTVIVDGKSVFATTKVKTGKDSHGFPIYETVKGVARCTPEDEFSLSTGVALAMDRLNEELGKNKINIGDKVKIKNEGLSYTTYIDWIEKNITSVGLAACYAYNQIPKVDNTVYVVKAIAPWKIWEGKNKGKKLAYIQRYFEYNNGKISDDEVCYLMSIEGLEKV